MKKIIFLVLTLLTITLCNAQSYNFEQGFEAYKKDDYDKALDYFSRDINDNPNAALTLYYRALIYKYQKENSKALKDINISIKHFSSKDKKMLSAAHVIRAEIYYNIDNIEKTFEDYAIAIKINPKNPSLYIHRAEIYYELQNFASAEADYKKALSIDESLTSAYAGLGRNYIELKLYQEADKVLNKLIKLAPESDIAYQYRGWLYYEQKQYDDAINDLYKSIQLDESNNISQNLFISYAEKNYPLAHSKIAAQIALNPDKEVWYIIRTSVYENQNKYFKAIEDYNKILTLSEENFKASIYNYRGKCYLNANVFDKALADFSKAIELDSMKADYYDIRGITKRYIGDTSGALADFTKAISIEPDDSWYYSSRGTLYAKIIKNPTAALEDYNMAISLNKKRASNFLQRGRLYKQTLKNNEKASEDFNVVLAIDTVLKSSNNCRHYALLDLGKVQESEEWVKKILDKYPTEGNYYDAACIYSLMNKATEAIDYLKIAFEKGYNNFEHLYIDEDLNNIKSTAPFKSLVAQWRTKDDSLIAAELKKELKQKSDSTSLQFTTITIPLKSKGSGTYEITCKINDLALNLIFDTGASDISISQTEVQFMLKNNYLSYNDIIGTKRYMDANGDIEVGTTVIFKTVNFGGLILHNVKAAVVHNKNAPLLFGQSALGKYGKFTIDNIKKTITITTNN